MAKKGSIRVKFEEELEAERDEPPAKYGKYEYDEKIAWKVRAMKVYGMDVRNIAKILDIGRRVIEALYAKDLKISKEALIAELGYKAYEMARNNNNPVMLMFVLKCQGGWREKDRVEEVKQQVQPQININLENPVKEINDKATSGFELNGTAQH